MQKINVLPKSIFELIAAGEVVDRPASAVKELIENSVDAGAKKITVEIKNGGLRYIRITDDGSGIDERDIRNAFVSHATSKIKSADDLDDILTLGFRGEALASIGAVSRVEVLTKTADSPHGLRYVYEGGVELSNEPAGCPDGTTMIIRDLFFNTPARMKFMKKDSTESSCVFDIVQKEALCNPSVAFTFIKDNRRTLFTPGDGKIASAISAIYGKDFTSSLIPCSTDDGQISIKGYITKPIFSRPNRQMQLFFVNGRYVKLPSASAALDNAYKNTVMVGKYPACVLFIEVDPRQVDVNIHPGKTQVRFIDESKLYNSVYFASIGALKCDTESIKVDMNYVDSKKIFGEKKDGSVQLRIYSNLDSSEELADSELKTTENDDLKPENEGKIADMTDTDGKLGEKTSFNSAFDNKKFTDEGEDFAENDDSGDEPDLLSNVNLNSKRENKPTEADCILSNSDVKIAEENSEYLNKYSNENVKLVGEAFNTYIIIEKQKRLIFIDKHAAHERIIFNDLKRAGKKISSQMLMESVVVSLDTRDYRAVLDNMDIFTECGYDMSDFGNGSVIVRSCPLELDSEDIREIVLEMADQLADGSREPMPTKLDWLYHSSSCRAAIKAGNTISDTEKINLALRVLNDESVRYCPHGRPVMFEITESSIKKMFGRIQ